MRALLVPVKAFSQAKARLARVLDQAARERLARALGSTVLAAADDLPRYVVCDDSDVADWAVVQGAQVLWTPGLGLSNAVTTGVRYLGEVGFDYVTVAHGDLPLVESLGQIGEEGGVALVPDHRLDGTNVASVPASAGYRFSYGQGSFSRHCLEAERLGLPLQVIHDPRLAYDIDTPEDLARFPNLLTEIHALAGNVAPRATLH